jgi:hypothetical protein
MLNRDFSLWMRTKSKNKVSAGYTGRVGRVQQAHRFKQKRYPRVLASDGLVA